jgi:type I restriction enzyme R subunit
MPMNDYTELTLVEQPAIDLFADLGWQTINCFREVYGPGGTLGRENSGEVVLVSRLRSSLRRINPDLPMDALDKAVDILVQDRSAMSMANANQEIYKLIKDGVTVSFQDGNEERAETVRVVDWDSPEKNDYLLTSQLWITGEIYKRRADLVGFVNGLPLVFVELKASHRRLEDAYNQNFTDYKSTIPQLFWYNAFVILSNGSKSRLGTITSELEHFSEWKKINSEGEVGIVSLETMIRGTCHPPRFLDLAENFILLQEVAGGLAKIVAKNHQYLGVNNAIEAVHDIKENQGRLGVFWHTQGSGKSFSMVFFTQKALRKIPGNFTFVVVTDRDDLDNQIFKNFATTGAVTESEENIRANSGQHLKQLLQEDHRYVFTLIQKFRTERGTAYPKLSDRSDVIVITDEAHRSQYDIFAQNMRNALPNAAFIGFTGTPLMVGEEKTRRVFGDYVSIYNFRQAIEDGATVPLYYENRIPELQLTNPYLNDEIQQIIDEAELDEAQEKKLERELGQQYHLITRNDRLDSVAEDIVRHFVGRGFPGKSMVISIDKATAVRMFDKVRDSWSKHLEMLKAKTETADDGNRKELENKIRFMEETDMAVVISQSQNEVLEFEKKGLEILPHRKRIVNEDLESKFKDPKDPLRMVFVCSMWITGFDVPSCSTIYLDKPMKNHTLMQTIARANRVFPQKVNGLIVDYVGVFRNLQKALAIYGSGSGGGIDEGDTPVRNKEELVNLLKQAIKETKEFCDDKKIDLNRIQEAQGLEKVGLLDEAVEAILDSDESKRKYLSLALNVNRLYKAILPDPDADEYNPIRTLFVIIAEKIRNLTPAADISEVMGAIETLLDDSIHAESYVIEPLPEEHLIDLNKIDFDKLRAILGKKQKRTATEQLRGAIDRKLKQMISRNRTRMDFLDKFQRMIEEYNSGAYNVEVFFERLIKFARELDEEEKRAMKENLTEEELAVFDLLTKPAMELSDKEVQQVKKVAGDLLENLKQEKIVLDWRKRQQSRAMVKLCIEEVLDQLPRVYTKELYEQKCDLVYQHVYDSYYGVGQSVYAEAA